MQLDAEAPQLEELRELVVDTTGNVRLRHQDTLLLDRARQRMRLRQMVSLEPYIELIKDRVKGAEELESLISELTIGETSLFRHGEQLDALRDQILPELIRRNVASRQLRIWSAGCANGAETYSIAIAVHDALGDQRDNWDVTIIGSDINAAFLREAERGVYSRWMFRNVAPGRMSAFTQIDAQSWAIKDVYRRNVRFIKHNLVSETVPAENKNLFAFDVIFCRNVMIYFDAATNLILTQQLADTLRKDGYLFVAPADFHAHLMTVFAAERIGGTTALRRRQPEAEPAVTKIATGDERHAARRLADAKPLRAVASPHNRASPTHANRHREKHSGYRASLAHKHPRQNHLNSRSLDSPHVPGAQKSAEIADAGMSAIIAGANRGDWAATEQICRSVLDADPCNVAAHYYLGLVLHSTDREDEAERAWRRAIYLDRGFALAHYQIGLVRRDAADLAGARKAFRNTIDALENTKDDQPVSPCAQITAIELREIAARQLAAAGQK